MITFVTTVTVRPENAAAWEEMMARVRDLTLANEPDVVHYGFGASADEPDRYAVVEVYRNAAAHAAHMATAWVTASIPESRRLVDGGFDIRQFVSPGTAPAIRRMQDR